MPQQQSPLRKHGSWKHCRLRHKSCCFASLSGITTYSGTKAQFELQWHTQNWWNSNASALFVGSCTCGFHSAMQRCCEVSQFATQQLQHVDRCEQPNCELAKVQKKKRNRTELGNSDCVVASNVRVVRFHCVDNFNLL